MGEVGAVGEVGKVEAPTLRARAWSRVRTYKCRACALRFPRRRSHCPSCRTRKGEYGYGIRRITWM